MRKLRPSSRRRRKRRSRGVSHKAPPPPSHRPAAYCFSLALFAPPWLLPTGVVSSSAPPSRLCASLLVCLASGMNSFLFPPWLAQPIMLPTARSDNLSHLPTWRCCRYAKAEAKFKEALEEAIKSFDAKGPHMMCDTLHWPRTTFFPFHCLPNPQSSPLQTFIISHTFPPAIAAGMQKLRPSSKKR